MTFKENDVYKAIPNLVLLVGIIKLDTLLIVAALFFLIAFKILLDFFSFKNQDALTKRLEDLERDVTSLKFSEIFKK